MKKTTRTGVIAFIAAMIVCAIFAFFAWGTNWFSSTTRLRKLFGDEAVMAPIAADHGLSKSAVNENNIYLDSEDVPTTVAVKYISAPYINFYGDKGICLYYQYTTTVGLKAKARIGIEPSYETKYEEFEFTNEHCLPYTSSGFDVSGPFNQHYISFTELDSALTKLGWNGTDKITIGVQGCAFNSVVGNYLESSWDKRTFTYFDTSATTNLNGATMTITVPNGVTGCSEYRTMPMDINFSDGASFSQGFNVSRDGCTVSGQTYTVDLTKLTCIDTPTERITVSCSLGNTMSSLPYLFPVPELSFAIAKLANPSNISFGPSGILSWDAVEGAQGYKLFFDDENSEFLTEPYYDFNGKAEGTYNLRIRAVGNVGTSLSRNATPFNVSSNIVQLVTLTYDVNGDTVTKFVPHGKELSDYLYEVKLDGYNFGGWYYDKGYSVAVNSFDKITADTTIYARLAEGEVEAPKTPSWFSQHKWQILIPVFVVVGLGVIALAAFAVKKKKTDK